MARLRLPLEEIARATAAHAQAAEGYATDLKVGPEEMFPVADGARSNKWGLPGKTRIPRNRQSKIKRRRTPVVVASLSKLRPRTPFK
jgi:hypothetical protein